MEEYDDLVPEPTEDGEVDMTHQGWKRLDDIVWKMEQIGDLILMKDLNISNNEISVLPNRIGDLRCLRKFQCQNNKIEYMPNEVGRCYMLEDLIANDNMLRNFPPSIIGCAALNTCDLRNNQLTAVPCELGSLVTMRRLYLEGNAKMANQIPAYCLADSFVSLFLLRMEFDFREEINSLRAINLELEYKVREREEYNLRIKEEYDEAHELLSHASATFPKDYVQVRDTLIQHKNQMCCCLNSCSIM